ncbi:hypothetical protein P8452_01564 [Trifolium repens]|nr:hypothetical protein P8452_01564 [Trifolium repens]
MLIALLDNLKFLMDHWRLLIYPFWKHSMVEISCGHCSCRFWTLLVQVCGMHGIPQDRREYKHQHDQQNKNFRLISDDCDTKKVFYLALLHCIFGNLLKESGVELSCTLWGHFATTLFNYRRIDAEPTVVIIKHVRIKDGSGSCWDPAFRQQSFLVGVPVIPFSELMPLPEVLAF